jgi:hypothetical protein
MHTVNTLTTARVTEPVTAYADEGGRCTLRPGTYGYIEVVQDERGDTVFLDVEGAVYTIDGDLCRWDVNGATGDSVEPIVILS